jgi:UDP-N-acetylglucosamine transferase subunit ALG13
MIFMTIGTLHPFDRLVQMVDELAGEGKLPEPVVAQIGHGAYQPKNVESYDILDKNEFDDYMDKAS